MIIKANLSFTNQTNINASIYDMQHTHPASCFAVSRDTNKYVNWYVSLILLYMQQRNVYEVLLWKVPQTLALIAVLCYEAMLSSC